MEQNMLLDAVASAIVELENTQDWQEALSILNEAYGAYMTLVRAGTKALYVSSEEIHAVAEATTEFGFSTEPGGINEGNEDAEEQYRVLDKLIGRWHAEGKEWA